MVTAAAAAAVAVGVYWTVGLNNLPQVREAGLDLGLEDDFLVSLLSLAAFCAAHHAATSATARPVLALAASVAAVVTAVEAVALSTGAVFGRYRFEPTGHFGPPLPGGMPLLVPVAWYCSIYTSLAVARAVVPRGRPAATAVAAAALAVGTSLCSDPLFSSPMAHGAWRFSSRGAYEARVAELGGAAAVPGLWTWLDAGSEPAFEGVPLRNFAGWFAVALLCVGGELAARSPAADAAAAVAVLAPLAHAATGLFYAAHPVHSLPLRAAGFAAMLVPGLAAALAVLRPGAPAPRAARKPHSS